MKKVVCILFLCIMVGFIGVQSAQCESIVVNGQEVDESGLPVKGSSVSPPLDATNFLDFSSPCLFSFAVPIPKNSYKHLGFTFNGNAAVVNECGAWGVTGHSSPNFLGFNCTATLANGKVPFLPEKITFNPKVRSVSLKIGSSADAGKQVALTAKAGSKTVDTETVTLAAAMTTVTLTSTEPNIKTLQIEIPQGSDTCYFVIDDITTTP